MTYCRPGVCLFFEMNTIFTLLAVALQLCICMDGAQQAQQIRLMTSSHHEQTLQLCKALFPNTTWVEYGGLVYEKRGNNYFLPFTGIKSDIPEICELIKKDDPWTLRRKFSENLRAFYAGETDILDVSTGLKIIQFHKFAVQETILFNMERTGSPVNKAIVQQAYEAGIIEDVPRFATCLCHNGKFEEFQWFIGLAGIGPEKLSDLVIHIIVSRGIIDERRSLMKTMVSSGARCSSLDFYMAPYFGFDGEDLPAVDPRMKCSHGFYRNHLEKIPNMSTLTSEAINVLLGDLQSSYDRKDVLKYMFDCYPEAEHAIIDAGFEPTADFLIECVRGGKVEVLRRLIPFKHLLKGTENIYCCIFRSADEIRALEMSKILYEDMEFPLSPADRKHVPTTKAASYFAK